MPLFILWSNLFLINSYLQSFAFDLSPNAIHLSACDRLGFAFKSIRISFKCSQQKKGNFFMSFSFYSIVLFFCCEHLNEMHRDLKAKPSRSHALK